MTAPVIRQFVGSIPDKGQAQITFDTNVDAWLDWTTLQFAPDLVALAPWMQARVLEVAATALSGTLPAIAAQAGNFLRVNAGATAMEFRTPAQLLGDLGVAAVPEVLVGQIAYYAMNTAPSGTLKANGALVSRTTYARLFAKIGTIWGVGDGSTTFALPDLRGEFARGWDDTRGVDAGRAFGSAQAAAFASHTHTGTAATAGAHTHTIPTGTNNGDNAGKIRKDSTSEFSNTENTSSSGNHSHTLTIAATGGAETRPRNIALLFCIKH